eukprot:EST47939.1 Hypothetical protein SS50377_11959 [Spironucleus salmonicida]
MRKPTPNQLTKIQNSENQKAQEHKNDTNKQEYGLFEIYVFLYTTVCLRIHFLVDFTQLKIILRQQTELILILGQQCELLQKIAERAIQQILVRRCQKKVNQQVDILG